MAPIVKFLQANKDLIFPFDWNEQEFPKKLDDSFLQPMKDLRKITYEDHSGHILCEVSGFEIIFCEKCGFIHVLNPPSKAELETFYKTKFYAQERKKTYFQEQMKSITWWNEIFQERLDKLENELGRTGKLLDVGCGPGFFLDFARKRSWDVCGIEPSSDACSFAKNELNLNVSLLSLENYLRKNSKEKFDVVYSHGVLEHVLDPKDFINKSRSLLNKNGLIFLSVANDFNPFQYAYLKQNPEILPWWLVPPEHLNYFTTNSLKRLVKNCNFNIKSVQNSFPIDMFLLMGTDYINEPKLGRQCHHNREKFELTMLNSGLGFLKNELYESLALLGIGRQTDIIGVKDG